MLSMRLGEANLNGNCGLPIRLCTFVMNDLQREDESEQNSVDEVMQITFRG